jgi:hypothetical protein
MNGPDGRRGRLPEIRTDIDTITFVMTVQMREGGTRQLVLRCDREGEIYASIVPAVVRQFGK